MALNNDLLDFSYHDDLILTGNGGISQDFDTLNTCQDAATKILQIHEKATGNVSPLNFAICVSKWSIKSILVQKNMQKIQMGGMKQNENTQ